MKMKKNVALAIYRALSNAKLAGVKDIKEKFAIVRLVANLNKIAEDFQSELKIAESKFATDDEKNEYVNECLNRGVEIDCDGFSEETIMGLIDGNPEQPAGAFAVIFELTK